MTAVDHPVGLRGGQLGGLADLADAAVLDEDGAAADVLGPDGYVTLAVRTRRTYAYSPAVTALADELAALKRYEEKARIAQCTKALGYVTVTKTRPMAA